MAFSAVLLRQQAATLGFKLVGLTRAQPSPQLAAYERWIAAGMHGTMGYMARPDRLLRRRDLTAILPGARSLVVVGLDYAAGGVPQAALTDPLRGRIAAYAWGVDYHEVLTPRLEALAAWLRQASGQAFSHRVYVDTGALLERSHAHEAGMGFTGKNTLLIHPRRGSSFFLGEILTDLEFDAYDQPGAATQCGHCTRCLNACPTGAFPQPHVLDARRCISYLTIEHKGSIPLELRPLMGNWVYGCDACQEVCPFQRFAPAAAEAVFQPADVDRAAPLLVDLLALDEDGFRNRYYGSPIWRIRRARLVRNACVAAGNSADSRFIPALSVLLDDADPLVRGHAAWALRRLLGAESRPLLAARLAREPDAGTAAEVRGLIEMI
jgi:epoxyqueuosine reductase